MLKDKVAIITGAGSGIGKSTANLFLREGANVGLIDMDHESLQQFKDEANSSDKVRFRTADVGDASMLKKAIDELIESFGRLDIVIINAGINGRVAPIENLDEEDWHSTMETNFKSTFMTLKYCIPYLKKLGGSVVITSSINGTRQFGNIGMSLYASSKAAQLAFGKMAALELSAYHIRVNVICPGYVKTNIQENTDSEHRLLKKVRIPIEYPQGNQPLEDNGAEAEDVADLILFLASDRSKHITGTEVYIDGGSTLL